MLSKLRVSIIIFPGSNCDRDLQVAVKNVFNCQPKLIWHKESCIKDTDIIFIPGGFSFGDYLRAGVIATKSPAIKEVKRLSKKKYPIVGICNGFQILTECNLLPGALIKNKNTKFLNKDIFLKIKIHKFKKTFNDNEILKLPIAHGQGNYFINNENLKKIEDNGQIILQYCNNLGIINFDSNPNGSVKNIAGIQNKEGNIIGMMPHPERAIDKENEDGKIFLKNLVNIL